MRFVLLLVVWPLAFGQTFSQEIDTCIPPCRSGYVCVKGQCVSECNPPCESGYKCINKDCIAIEQSKTIKLESNLENRKPIQGNPYLDYSEFPYFWFFTAIVSFAGVVDALAEPKSKSAQIFGGIGLPCFVISFSVFAVKNTKHNKYMNWNKDHGIKNR